jgi:hypothetical protein
MTMSRHTRIQHICFVLACTAFAPGFASADQVCHTATISSATTNWNNSLSVPKFDPNLGVLTAIQFTLTGTETGSAEAESLDAQPSTVTLNFQCTLTLTRPDNSVIVIAIPLQTFVDHFTAFDGTIDFRGTSGATHANINVSDTQSANSPPPASDLVLFTGPAGNPGMISLPITAAGTSNASGAGNLITQFNQAASASLSVCYTYTPPFHVFCIGDGSGSTGPCPCMNDAPSGTTSGCLNSSGLGGVLTATGVPSISHDTLHLTITQLPMGAQGWFVQADGALNGGHGAPFGDGENCLQGNIIFMQKIAIGGNVLPPPGSPPISVLFGIMAGQTKYYQGWYREPHPVGPCGGMSMNTTNGIVVNWGV